MASISNINNNFNTLITKTKISKMEDSKVNQYVLRKHIDYSISNSFIHKEIPFVSSYVPSIKSQVEEIQKLQSEICNVEDKIRNLEVSKKVKLSKIEDLRSIIERIADEECFDCVFTTRVNNSFNYKEKNCTNSSSKRRSSDSLPLIKVHSVNSTTTQETADEEIAETEGDGEANKQGILCNCLSCCISCRRANPCEMPRHLHDQREEYLQNSLLFWQENLATPKKLFKA